MAIFDFLFPKLCLCCGRTEMTRDDFFCPSCWKDLVFIQEPYCSICGLPFSFRVNDDALDADHSEILCPSCEKQKPFFKKARSIFVYNEAIKKPILRFKNSDQTQYGKEFSLLLYKFLKNTVDEVDCLIPVPLHPKRLFERKYNQSALIAGHLEGLVSKKVFYNALERIKNTPSQDHKSRCERFSNMDHAFHVKNSQLIRDKKILLVDDVMTTGATLDACAKALKQVGAASVHTVSIARSAPHITS